METFGVSFEDERSLYNVFSKAVTDSSFKEQILDHASVGDKMYKKFVEERFKGEASLWSAMKKVKLKTFNSFGKITKRKVDAKVIQLKEGKTLLSRFLITARKRPDLNLEECLGNFEFSVVPKSLFSPDGQLLLCTDKSSILHHIEDLLKDEGQEMKDKSSTKYT